MLVLDRHARSVHAVHAGSSIIAQRTTRRQPPVEAIARVARWTLAIGKSPVSHVVGSVLYSVVGGLQVLF